MVAKKGAAVLRTTGRLACEVCDFDSSEAYGIEGVIDVHHVVPLHQLGESVTGLNDLALLCPTCHRVLHQHRPIISPDELRAKRFGS
ncbi:HNH endonuclease [Auraticoccus cholistanensis]|uniref:HNH endonuclease n=1 Tax=Auraticoccus cholistanensis TaxID=2656650 RepID=UPI0038BD3CCF